MLGSMDRDFCQFWKKYSIKYWFNVPYIEMYGTEQNSVCSHRLSLRKYGYVIRHIKTLTLWGSFTLLKCNTNLVENKYWIKKVEIVWGESQAVDLKGWKVKEGKTKKFNKTRHCNWTFRRRTTKRSSRGASAWRKSFWRPKNSSQKLDILFQVKNNFGSFGRKILSHVEKQQSLAQIWSQTLQTSIHIIYFWKVIFYFFPKLTGFVMN